MDLTAAAIATLISSGVATLVTLLINKQNKLRSLNDQLDDIIKIGIQYPYLESPRFTETWMENKESEDDKYLRYENYCTLVFNYLERVFEHYRFDKTKIEAQPLNVKDWVRTHKQCWEHPSIPYENLEGYSEKFREIINGYLK